MHPRNPRTTTSRYDRWHAATAIAITGLITTPAIVAPAWAGTLSAWGFNVQNQHLTLTIPTGTKPTFFLMAQPPRIVLDIPNTRLGEVARSQQLTGVVRSIRLSENGDNTRIVLELAPNTRLDPRHADLTATDLGNGRTQWVLTPLIQGEAPPAVAVTPSVSAPPPVAPASTPPERTTPVPPPTAQSREPVVADPAPSPSQVSPADRKPTSVPAADAVNAAPAASTATETTAAAPRADAGDQPNEADQPTLPSPESLPTVPTEAAITLPVPPPPTAIPPASPLPSVATTAAVGAAAALPDATIARRGVRTDAAPLMGVGQLDIADVPPGELPIDPFLAQNPAVSVPPLAEGSRIPTATVSVPPLSEVPEVAAAPNSPAPNTAPREVAIAPAPPAQSPETLDSADAEGTTESSTPETTLPVPPVASPDATPPSRAEVEVAQNLPQTAPSRETASVPPPPFAPLTSEAEVQAGNSVPMPGTPSTPIAPIEIPVIPMAPDSWQAIAQGTVPDNELPPPWPDTAVTEEDTPVPSPPETNRDTRDTSVVANSAAASPTQAPPFLAGTSPAVEGDRLATPPPPTQLAGLPSIDGEVELPPPPFLETAGQAPLPTPAEIPPPPDPGKTGVIPFGAPLQTKALDAATASDPALPIGTRFALQYTHSEPLVLEQQQPVYEVLRVVGDVYHPETGEVIIPAGTPVLGRFEGFDESGRRFVTQFMPVEGDRSTPLLAESDWLVGTPQPRDATGAVAGAAVGATAVTLISGFSGLGLVGGAAIGAAAALGNAPRLVIIDPGETIQVEVVSDILPFH